MMKMTIDQLLKWGADHPKKVFLADGFGAILSAILLGVVLVQLESVFGIPKTTLYFLASLPCLFAIYDVFAYFKGGEKTRSLLKGIAIANLAYCALSMGLAIYHFQKITQLGWIYLIIEIMIVTAVGIYELKVASKLPEG